MSTHVAQCIVQARMAELADALAFVDRFCAAQHIDSEPGLRLTLVVEELFSNTVQHGHRGDAASPVRLVLALGAQGIELFYEDRAPAFDPLAWARAHPAPPTPDAETAGGRGVLLVQQFSSAARYAFEEDCNRLWLQMPLQPRR
jgi:anti-sigma regulatory factor (Ser/Thr protein kinase)